MSSQGDRRSGGGVRTPLLAAVVLAVAVGAVATVVRWTAGSNGGATARPSVSPAVSPSASPTPRPAPFPVRPAPTDRPLLWFQVASDAIPTAVRLRATGWDGREAGTLEVPCRQPCGWQASPDGQRILVWEQPAANQPQEVDGQVVDATGAQAGSVRLGGGALVWADDSRRLCLLRGPGGETSPAGSVTRVELDLADPASAAPPRPVNAIAGIESQARAYWSIHACSVAADRAVLTYEARDGVHDVRVIQLSTGRTLYARDDITATGVCGCPVVTMAVSRDGSLAVENLDSGAARLRDLGDGRLVSSSGALPGRVLGLSWNGTVLVTSRGIVDRASGRLLWSSPVEVIVPLAMRPGAEDVLVALTADAGSWTAVIVRGDGTTTWLPAGYA